MNSGLSILFRVVLVLVSLCTTVYFLRKIRKSKVQIQDVLFWIIFSIVLLVLCVFPKIVSFFSDLLGVQSPVNLLFLVIIFLLMVHQFALTIKISMLEKKLYQLGREYALKMNAQGEKSENVAEGDKV